MATADDYSQSEKVALGGAGLAAVGAFLPWVSISLGPLGSATKNGIDADGTITLILALVAVGVVVLRNWDQVEKGVVVAAGVITAAIGVLYIVDPAFGTDVSGTMMENAFSPGIGLYVTALGGLGMLVGGGLGLQD